MQLIYDATVKKNSLGFANEIYLNPKFGLAAVYCKAVICCDCFIVCCRSHCVCGFCVSIGHVVKLLGGTH